MRENPMDQENTRARDETFLSDSPELFFHIISKLERKSREGYEGERDVIHRWDNNMKEEYKLITKRNEEEPNGVTISHGNSKMNSQKKMP